MPLPTSRRPVRRSSLEQPRRLGLTGADKPKTENCAELGRVFTGWQPRLRVASLAFVGFVAKSLSLALICSASVSSRSFFVIDPARKGAKTNFPFGF
jgi:hypothetical protein